MNLSPRSELRLNGVHPDLVKVVRLAAATPGANFVVLEGLRSKERQLELFKAGATRTMNSRHLTGHAVDIAPMDGDTISWAWPAYYPLAALVKAAAKSLKVEISWGGDWSHFRDGPHWELAWEAYP